MFKEWCMTFKSLQLHVFSREKGWKMGPVFCVWKSPEKKFFKMFKQIQKYVLVDKKVLWVSPVYPNMSLILDRLDPFNYSLSKRNKKYEDHPATHTWEEWSTAISVQNNCCPRAVFVMKLKKRFSLSVALWWYWYHYSLDLFLPLQQNQESHQYQIEACLDEIFATRSSDYSPVL